MKYYIFEETTYEAYGVSPQDALNNFQENLKYPSGLAVTVHERNVYDEGQNDVTEEAEAEYTETDKARDLAFRRKWCGLVGQ
jgi:hypothetical protein